MSEIKRFGVNESFLWDRKERDCEAEVVLASDHDAAVKALRDALTQERDDRAKQVQSLRERAEKAERELDRTVERLRVQADLMVQDRYKHSRIVLERDALKRKIERVAAAWLGYIDGIGGWAPVAAALQVCTLADEELRHDV